MAADGAAAEAFRALADALAGSSWDGDAAPVSGSALVPIHMNRRPAGIFQTAATANDAASAETSARAATLVTSLAAEPLAAAFAAAGAEVSDAACRLARAATAACDADAQAPLLAAAEAVALAADARSSVAATELRREGEAGAHGETAVGDVSFRVAAAVFVGARPDATYPRDADAGTAVASALARLATRRAYRAQSDTRDLLVGEQNARARDVAVPLAAAHALASLVLKRGGSGALGAEGGSAAATAAGVASPESLGSVGSIGARAAGGVLRALAARGDPAERALARRLVAALAHDDPRVAAGAARALGEAMSPRGGGAGATRACHGFERPLFRQRFFAQTLPDVLAALAAAPAGEPAELSSSSRAARRTSRRWCTWRATRRRRLRSSSASGRCLCSPRRRRRSRRGARRSPTRTRSPRRWCSSRRSSPTRAAERALEAHADAHAGAMLGALRTLAGAGGEGKGRERAVRDEPSVIVGMEVRETALEALVAAISLPFAAVYPHRRAVAAAATAALDDPKRRVRRAAARCREVWLALDAKS